MVKQKEYDAAYDRGGQIFDFLVSALDAAEGESVDSKAGFWAGVMGALTDHMSKRGGLRYTGDVLKTTLETVQELQRS